MSAIADFVRCFAKGKFPTRIQALGRTLYVLHSNITPSSVPKVLQDSMDAAEPLFFEAV
jgi:hypothetical protein